MSPLRRRLLRGALAAGVTATLLAGVGSAVGWRAIGAALAAVDGRWAAVALATVLAVRVAETAQMTWVLRRAGLVIGAGRVLMAKGLGTLYAVVLPGDLVGGVAKWSSLAASTGDRSRSFHGVVYNRAVLFAAELSLGLVALLLHPPWSSPAATATVAVAALALGIVLAVVYHPRAGSGLDRRLLALAERGLPHAVARRGRALSEAAEAFRAFPGRLHLGFFAGACGIVLLRSLVLVSWAAALHLPVPWLALVWTEAVLSLLLQLPVTLGGLGVRETALVALLAPFGVAAGRAFALGLLVFAGIGAFVAVGLVCQALLVAGVVSWRGPGAPGGETAAAPPPPGGPRLPG